MGDDRRIYAIGDIHGRLDLLDQLLGMLVADNALRPTKQRRLILLGDLIDRGPHSAQVIERVRALHGSGGNIGLVKGNHEEIFVMAARGDQGAVGFFRRIGGVETLASYGLPPSLSADMDDQAIAHWMLNHIPRADVDFLDSFVDHMTVGDYLFVHAGIRPRVAIAEQRPSDLRWIRGDFLNHAGKARQDGRSWPQHHARGRKSHKPHRHRHRRLLFRAPDRYRPGGRGSLVPADRRELIPFVETAVAPRFCCQPMADHP
ncbi:metallophosphoesterase [Sphingobium scionense]